MTLKNSNMANLKMIYPSNLKIQKKKPQIQGYSKITLTMDYFRFYFLTHKKIKWFPHFRLGFHF